MLNSNSLKALARKEEFAQKFNKYSMKIYGTAENLLEKFLDKSK